MPVKMKPMKNRNAVASDVGARADEQHPQFMAEQREKMFHGRSNPLAVPAGVATGASLASHVRRVAARKTSSSVGLGAAERADAETVRDQTLKERFAEFIGALGGKGELVTKPVASGSLVAVIFNVGSTAVRRAGNASMEPAVMS
jgi:hypothetical protein